MKDLSESESATEQALMDYKSHNPARYAPSREEAVEQGRRGIRAIREWLPPLGDAPILEIGCGAGNLLLAFEEAGYTDVTGVDLAPELVEHGQNVLGIRALHGDWLSYLSSSGRNFGLIVALDVIEHLAPNAIEPTLRATRRRLIPGGRLVLRMPNAKCPFVLPTFFGDLTHRSLIAPDLLEHLLRKAGFGGSIVFAETRPHNLLKRAIFTVLHMIVVKPILSGLYFHFYQEFPRVLTRNIYCCAFANGGE
jgi:SAM-dependent methyltransferase